MKEIAAAIRCNRLYYKETLKFMSETASVISNLNMLRDIEGCNRARLDKALNRVIRVGFRSYILEPEYRGAILSKLQDAKNEGWGYLTYKYVNAYDYDDTITVSIRCYTSIYHNFMLTGRVEATNPINQKAIQEYNMFMSGQYSDECKEIYGDMVEEDLQLYETFKRGMDSMMDNEMIDGLKNFVYDEAIAMYDSYIEECEAVKRTIFKSVSREEFAMNALNILTSQLKSQ